MDSLLLESSMVSANATPSTIFFLLPAFRVACPIESLGIKKISKCWGAYESSLKNGFRGADGKCPK